MKQEVPVVRVKTAFSAFLGMVVLLSIAGCDMKSVYLVEVNDSKKPVFPDFCVVCMAQKHEGLTTMTMSDDNCRIDFYLYKISNKNAVGSLLEIPVHDTCVKSLRNGALKHIGIILLAALSIVAIGFFSRYDIFGFIVAAIIIATPFLYLEFMSPMPVEFYRHDRTYFMLFKDENYAKEFARLNNARVRVSQYPYFGNAD